MVTVDGKGLNLLEWQNKKALKLLIYLLVSPKHRIPVEHLCYLLWPGERSGREIRKRLYTAVSFLRGKLGEPEYLVKRYDNYHLENVTTDLEDLEGLVIRAEATSSYEKREEILSRARALASGELLHEITDDEYVDEYRTYYRGLKKGLSWNTELYPRHLIIFAVRVPPSYLRTAMYIPEASSSGAKVCSPWPR